MNKKQEEAKRHEEDLALRQGLLWVAAAIVLEILLFFVGRYAFHYTTSAASVNLAIALRGGLKIARILGLVAGVAGAVMAVLQAKKGKKALWYGVAAIVALTVMVCAHAMTKYQTSGAQMLKLLVPVLGGLALTFYIYPREFFLPALSCVLSALGLWFVRGGGLGLDAILTVLALVLVLLVLVSLKKNDGQFALAGLQMRLLPEKADYKMALGVCLVALVALLAALVAGGVVAYYLVFGMGAVLFALLVYYTVKMM